MSDEQNCREFDCHILAVSVATNIPAQRGASRQPLCTQMSTVSVINW